MVTCASFLRSSEKGRFQTVAVAEHHLRANRVSKLDKLWRQTGFRDTAATAKKSVNSINSTSGGTCMATRNHVAMAAWSIRKSHVSGRPGFDWSGQQVKLKGSTVLLALVYLRMGWRSRSKTSKRCGACKPDQGPRATVHLYGRLEYDSRGNADNRIGMLHWRGDQDSCGRRVHLHLWKQTPGLASVVQLEPCWAVPC